jgi:predicted Zn-dependent peptidase
MIAALATGHTSRLGRALVGGGIAASVEATLDRGFVVTLRTSPQFIDTAEATLLRELDRLRRERLTDGELQRACNQASRTWWGRFSRLREVASLLGGFEAGEGNALQALEYGARLLGVSTLDVNRVAREIFNAGSLRVVEHLPHGGIDRSFTADAFAATVDSWAPGLGKHVSEDEVRAAPAQPRITEGRPRQSEVQPAWSPIAVPVRDFSTKHGPTAFVAEDQMLPLVSIGVFVAGGRSQETDSQQGLTELLLSVVAWQPDGKLQLIEQLGGELRPVVARDWFGLVVEAPSRNAELVTMALVDLFEHSSLDQKAMELQRRRLDLSAPFLAEEPLARAEELYWQGRFQGHPYGRTRSDTRVLARVTLEDLAMWRATTIGVQTPLVGVVGDSDGSSLVAAFFAEAFERTEAAAPPRVQPLPNLSQSTERAEYRSGRVTSVVVGYPAVTLQEALDALEVVAAWAGSAWGPAGRRLRGVDARATLRSAVARDRIASSILFGFEASPASEPGLTAALDAQVRGLASTPMSDADLRTSKALAAIRLEMAVENPSERLLRYAGETMRGGRAAAAELAPQRVQLITAPLLRQVAEGTFVPSHSGRGMVRAH